jgi:hypothetical protein
VRHFNLDTIGGGADDDSGEYPPSRLLGPGFHHRLALSNSVIKRLARLRAKVRRRKIATQPFRVMRGRMRGVFARNPRSHSRSTTAGGRRFLKNAKCPKKPRSPANDSPQRASLVPEHGLQERAIRPCGDLCENRPILFESSIRLGAVTGLI